MSMRPGTKDCRGEGQKAMPVQHKFPRSLLSHFLLLCLTHPDIPQDSQGSTDQSTPHTINIHFTITILLVFMLKTNSPLGFPFNSIGTWWIL